MTTPEESARKFAKKIRDLVDFEGSIRTDKLKGKYIEYVDLQNRLMIRKVIKIGPATVKVIDATKRKHTVRHERILWAFQRRNNNEKLKVNP